MILENKIYIFRINTQPSHFENQKNFNVMIRYDVPQIKGISRKYFVCLI